MADGNGNGVSKADEIDDLLHRVLRLVKEEQSYITAHLIEMAILNQRKRNAKQRRRGCYD